MKVGKTSDSVAQRMKSLDSTGVPLPFEYFYAARVKDMDFVESQIHDAFRDTRVRERRKYFSIDWSSTKEVALDISLIANAENGGHGWD